MKLKAWVMAFAIDFGIAPDRLLVTAA